MIIALEGPPATGKSTTAKRLASDHGFFLVPEVNELFPTRPAPEPAYWYAARQIERCELASNNQDSVLDGDPFQAAWFSWLYPERGFPEFSAAMAYFLDNADSMILPSFYTYMYVDAETRYERERGREKARGHDDRQFSRKWNRYADMLAPQRAIFDAIAKAYPGWVVTIEAKELESVIRVLLGVQPPKPPEPVEFIAWFANWLKRNKSRDFR
jgi:hypothetical protein